MYICSPGWLGAHCVAHAGLELVSGLLVLLSLVLGLQVCATRLCSEYVLNLLVFELTVTKPGITFVDITFVGQEMTAWNGVQNNWPL